MNPFFLLIPRRWAPEEALAAVRLLRMMVEAIWEIHGEEMAAAAFQDPERWPLDELLEEPPYSPDEDDIPF